MEQPLKLDEEMSNDVNDIVVERIKYALTIYPILSPSMLQVGIGNNINSSVWRPLLQKLIEDGIVFKQELLTETPAGRKFPHTRLSLTPLQ